LAQILPGIIFSAETLGRPQLERIVAIFAATFVLCNHNETKLLGVEINWRFDKGGVKVLRVAIVHDWLVTWRGGEKVLESIASLYPDAPIFTLFCDFSILPETLRHRKIVVHPVANRLRFMRKALLPFFPIWIESMDLSGFDLVISTSSCVAKGVLIDPAARHLCYIHSPMRYIWDQRDEYVGTVRRIPVVGFFVDLVSSLLRVWDTASATRVDVFVANSNFIKKRVQKYYGRSALVVHPPVDVNRFKGSNAQPKKGYLLAAGAFVGYKRFDLAIAACESLGRKLIVAGQGPDLETLKSLAGPNTTIINAPSDAAWVTLMREAEGLLFPGVEDFGITAIEAMAAGTPVIAYKAGGALDYIVEDETGVFFSELTVDSLKAAIGHHQTIAWSRQTLEQHSAKFGGEGFAAKMRVVIDELLEPEIT
jgi:glycosyltransferase involved in cell wall biosynthesis